MGTTADDLRKRGIEAGRNHVSEMEGNGLLLDFLAGRSEMIRNQVMTAAYKAATAVLEEDGGKDAESYLAGFVEGADAAFVAMRASIAPAHLASQ